MINYDELFQEMSRLSVKLNKIDLADNKKAKSSEVFENTKKADLPVKSVAATEAVKLPPADFTTPSTDNKNYGSRILFCWILIIALIFGCIWAYTENLKASNYVKKFKHTLINHPEITITEEVIVRDRLPSEVRHYSNDELLKTDYYDSNGKLIKSE